MPPLKLLALDDEDLRVVSAHVQDAVLRVADIAPWLEEAPLAGPQPRAHYWITGVSGTTDIEGTYVRGAHGPRFLHVILLRGDFPHMSEQ